MPDAFRPLPLPDPPLAAGPVRLRPWAPADAGVLVAGWTDPDVVRWNPVPGDRSEAAAERWIAGAADRRRQGLAVDLVIDAEGSGPAGEVGVARVRAPLPTVEVGFWLLPTARGRGLATVAARLAAGWAVTLGTVFARTDPANAAAGRVLERAGFELRGRAGDGRQVWGFSPAEPR